MVFVRDGKPFDVQGDDEPVFVAHPCDWGEAHWVEDSTPLSSRGRHVKRVNVPTDGGPKQKLCKASGCPNPTIGKSRLRGLCGPCFGSLPKNLKDAIYDGHESTALMKIVHRVLRAKRFPRSSV